MRADINVPKKIKTGADTEGTLSPSPTAEAASGLKFTCPACGQNARRVSTSLVGIAPA